MSAKESLVVLNFVSHSKRHHKADFSDATFLKNGWAKMSEVRFGELGFQWRYPDGVESNKSLGFVFYRKE